MLKFTFLVETPCSVPSNCLHDILFGLEHANLPHFTFILFTSYTKHSGFMKGSKGTRVFKDHRCKNKQKKNPETSVCMSRKMKHCLLDRAAFFI